MQHVALVVVTNGCWLLLKGLEEEGGGGDFFNSHAKAPS